MSDSGKPSRYSSGAAGQSPRSDPAAQVPVLDAKRFQELFGAALAHLFRLRPDLAQAPVAELSRAMPDRPDVQYLVRSIAIIGFEWPAERLPLTLSRREAPRQQDVDLVAFHMDLPQASAWFGERVDYMTVLSHSMESASIRAPAARRLLITDERTAVPESLPVHQVLRFPIDPERVMYERMRVQEIYLRERDPARASVLMDSDIVVNADPAAIFTEDFDVGLTWRPQVADAPFNGGVILAAPGYGAHMFFERTLACYRAIAADARLASVFQHDLKGWWGDQFALALLVGHRAFAERSGDALLVDGARVKFFPCSEYNFTLEGGKQDPATLRRKFFVHFKGQRKAMLAQYLEYMRAGKI